MAVRRNSDAPQRKSRLSYNPTVEELPLYESLFQVCDLNKTGTKVTYEAAQNLLSRSSLPYDVIKMIISMTINEGALYLDRYQFFITVRLVQLRQNRVSVQNLTLTVPNDVHLKPPYFKGISKVFSTDQDAFEDGKQDGGFSCSNCIAKETEVEKLRRELRNAKIHVDVLTKENARLQNKISDIESSNNFGEENEMLNKTIVVNRENNFTEMGPEHRRREDIPSGNDFGRDQMSRPIYHTRTTKDGSVGYRRDSPQNSNPPYDDNERRNGVGMQQSHHSRMDNLENVLILPDDFDLDDPEPTFDSNQIPREFLAERQDSLVSDITTSFAVRPRSNMTRNIDDSNNFDGFQLERKNQGKMNLRSMLMKRTKSLKSILTDKN